MKTKLKGFWFYFVAILMVFIYSFSSLFARFFLYQDDANSLKVSVNDSISLNAGPAVLTFPCSSQENLLSMETSLREKVKNAVSFSRFLPASSDSFAFQVDGTSYSYSIGEASTVSDTNFSLCNHHINAVANTSFQKLNESGNYVFIPLSIATRILPDSEKAKNNYAFLNGKKMTFSSKDATIDFEIWGVFGYSDDASYLAINDAISNFVLVSESTMEQFSPQDAFVRFSDTRLANNRAVETLTNSSYFDFDQIQFPGSRLVQTQISDRTDKYRHYFSSGLFLVSLPIVLLLDFLFLYCSLSWLRIQKVLFYSRSSRVGGIIILLLILFLPVTLTLFVNSLFPMAFSLFGLTLVRTSATALFNTYLFVSLIFVLALLWSDSPQFAFSSFSRKVVSTDEISI